MEFPLYNLKCGKVKSLDENFQDVLFVIYLMCHE